MADEKMLRKDDKGREDHPEDSRHRSDRRKLIKSAVAAVPVVLTIGAGTAKAGSGGGSGLSGDL